MSFPILNQYQKQFLPCSDLIAQFEPLFNKKLWNELSQSLLQFIFHHNVKGKLTFQFYTDFVKKFQRNIDQINHLKIIKECLVSVPREEAIEFLKNFQEKQAFTDETKNIALALRANYFISTDLSQCLQWYHKIENYLNQRRDVDAFVFSTFYKFGMNYFTAKKKQKLFYNNALQYLAYTSAAEVEENQKLDMLTKMAIAVIISSQIYNFSELLQQPMLLTLKNSQNQWIYNLLQIFNKGDIKSFSEPAMKNSIQKNELLKNSKKALEQKIRLMAFIELAFNLPKNNRVVSFKKLANVCEIELEHVEFMVMKASSLNLVKVQINQISQEVLITWVAPKVLENEKIGVMLNKIEEWQNGVGDVRNFIAENRKQ